MATKKRKSPDSSCADGNDLVPLIKAVIGLKKQQEGFGKSVDTLKETLDGYFENLELQIQSKQRERDDIEEETNRQLKSRRIAVDQDVKEHGYKAAQAILTEREEVSISSAELASLHKSIMESNQEMADAIKQEKKKAEKSVAMQLRNKELEFTAAQAEIQAALKQKDKEIEVLMRTIKDLKSDLEKQRMLTQAVAESSRPQYMPVPTQTSDRR